MSVTNSDNWTWEDFEYLYQHYHNTSAKEIAEHLNRTENCIHVVAAKIGIVTSAPYSEEELKLAKEYGDVLGSSLCFLLPKRGIPAMEDLIKCANAST